MVNQTILELAEWFQRIIIKGSKSSCKGESSGITQESDTISNKMINDLKKGMYGNAHQIFKWNKTKKKYTMDEGMRTHKDSDRTECWASF